MRRARILFGPVDLNRAKMCRGSRQRNMTLDTGIARLKHFDVYRDGGSISASFVGEDGIEYCLFFQVRHPPAPEEPRRYGAVKLKWVCPYMYRSPVTGDTSPMGRADSCAIDWQEARTILNELRPFVADREPIFEDMVQAVADHVPAPHPGGAG